MFSWLMEKYYKWKFHRLVRKCLKINASAGLVKTLQESGWKQEKVTAEGHRVLVSPFQNILVIEEDCR